jgi:hypothetical protein
MYAANTPLLYTDPSGRCYDQLGFLRDVEPGNCHNLDMAIKIFNHPNASLKDRTAAYAYISTWTASHAMLLVGAGILTWEGATAVSLWGSAAMANAPTTVQTAAVATVIVADKVDDALMYFYAALGDEQAVADYQALQQLGTSDPSPVCDVLAAGIIFGGRIGPDRQLPLLFPLGFHQYDDFLEFGHLLRRELQKMGYDDVTIFFVGSSVTGVKYTTGKPFDVGRKSDFDIALVSPSLFQRAKEMGIPLRGGGTRTSPIKTRDARRLGLDAIQQELSTKAGRETNFMIYRSQDALNARGQHSMSVPSNP